MAERVAIVTGAASGIGLAIAEHLTGTGHRVVLADVNEPAGRTAADRLNASFTRVDLQKQIDCRRLVEQTVAQFGTVHILINNAGFQHISPIDEFPEEKWSAMIAVMLTAPFLLTKYVWPHMKAQQWGRIVNMSSIHGLVASPFKSAYNSAKHGLIGLTRTTALEGGTLGITVNAVCPGFVRTPLVEGQIADQARTTGVPIEDVVEKVMLAPAAIKRLIEPSEIAALVGYLVSDAAAPVTGAAFSIDAGWTAR